MLPRRQSIFHLGEDVGNGGGSAPCHRRGVLGGAPSPSPSSMSGRVRERLVVGLQILVHQQKHGGGGGRQAHAANVVLKQMVRRPGGGGFLKACSLCRRELSPNKDVYMYRGDQGFCSEECRGQQILLDEAREREAAGKERRRALQARHQAHQQQHTPIGGRPRKTTTPLAVA